jgi:hypothetical protein
LRACCHSLIRFQDPHHLPSSSSIKTLLIFFKTLIIMSSPVALTRNRTRYYHVAVSLPFFDAVPDMRRAVSAPTLATDTDVDTDTAQAQRPVTLETELALVPGAAEKKLKIWSGVIKEGLYLKEIPFMKMDPIEYGDGSFCMCFMVMWRTVPERGQMFFPERCHSTIVRAKLYPNQQLTAADLITKMKPFVLHLNMVLQAAFLALGPKFRWMAGDHYVMALREPPWNPSWTLGVCRPMYQVLDSLVHLLYGYLEGEGLIGFGAPMWVKELREHHISWE